MTRVLLDNVHFSYPVYELTGRSLKISLVRQFANKGVEKRKNGFVEVHAIRGISLDLKAGDRVGLLGHNGSGKSTLLRIFAGVAHPTSGRMLSEGRVIPLIEKGLGINPELSGYDNIELPLRLIGASSAEVQRARKSIPDFTGLGDFIHMPVRTYSEGMKARLAFAICTAIDGDILVLDEWLGAGDIDFMDRAQHRMVEVAHNSEIVILASHSLDLILNVCNKAVWIEQGCIRAQGPPASVVPMYIAAQGAGEAAHVGAKVSTG